VGACEPGSTALVIRAKILRPKDIDFGSVSATGPFSFAPRAPCGYKPATIPKMPILKNNGKEA
jgi:hypothetical protein